MPAPPPLGPGLCTRTLRIADAKVVELRAILEAYDGLAMVYGDGTGHVVVTTTASQLGDLDAVLEDLRAELGFDRTPER